MTQNEEILAHLKTGQSITPIHALSEFGCFRLAARISDLRGEGHSIETVHVTDKKSGKTFAQYRMAA